MPAALGALDFEGVAVPDGFLCAGAVPEGFDFELCPVAAAVPLPAAYGAFDAFGAGHPGRSAGVVALAYVGLLAAAATGFVDAVLALKLNWEIETEHSKIYSPVILFLVTAFYIFLSDVYNANITCKASLSNRIWPPGFDDIIGSSFECFEGDWSSARRSGKCDQRVRKETLTTHIEKAASITVQMKKKITGIGRRTLSVTKIPRRMRTIRRKVVAL